MYSVRRERSTSSAGGSQSFSGAPAVAHAAVAASAELRLVALELVRVVRAEQRDLVAVAGGQLAQPLLVGLALALRSAALRFWKKRRPGGQLGGRGDLAVVEVGVAAVQQPALAGLDRDPGVAERVADQRDQQHLGAEAGQDAHALEAEPLVAFGRRGGPSAGRASSGRRR